ncbi:periplasmic heavy metal sensor [Aliiroseovarius sp. KMU-50]|uniref:Periplasmic heavy metal sensor n=1 Tax=Aliiroseovarius salicola TaxID=3009082 RepID=A0ABT4W0Y0_9RHOB|nr:periplasmic heavy metal sensor [Aliiroseovarius sp. KMU-50]MDA5094116.1 periplasmic heavy metal sensor [Aliiroseovarius sp. KMU-50]
MSDIQPPKTQETRATPKKRKLVKVIFVLSLTLNLLVLGLVVGAHIGDRRDYGFNPRGPDRSMIRALGFGPIASALPLRERRAIAKALRAERGSFAENRTAIRRDFKAMIAVLQAENFDPDALHALLDGQRDRMLKLGETARLLVIDRISRMSREERMEFAEEILEKVRFERRKFPKHSKDGN